MEWMLGFTILLVVGLVGLIVLTSLSDNRAMDSDVLEPDVRHMTINMVPKSRLIHALSVDPKDRVSSSQIVVRIRSKAIGDEYIVERGHDTLDAEFKTQSRYIKAYCYKGSTDADSNLR